MKNILFFLQISAGGYSKFRTVLRNMSYSKAFLFFSQYPIKGRSLCCGPGTFLSEDYSPKYFLSKLPKALPMAGFIFNLWDIKAISTPVVLLEPAQPSFWQHLSQIPRRKTSHEVTVSPIFAAVSPAARLLRKSPGTSKTAPQREQIKCVCGFMLPS